MQGWEGIFIAVFRVVAMQEWLGGAMCVGVLFRAAITHGEVQVCIQRVGTGADPCRNDGKEVEQEEPRWLRPGEGVGSCRKNLEEEEVEVEEAPRQLFWICLHLAC